MTGGEKLLASNQSGPEEKLRENISITISCVRAASHKEQSFAQHKVFQRQVIYERNRLDTVVGVIDLDGLPFIFSAKKVLVKQVTYTNNDGIKESFETSWMFPKLVIPDQYIPDIRLGVDAAQKAKVFKGLGIAFDEFEYAQKENDIFDNTAFPRKTIRKAITAGYIDKYKALVEKLERNPEFSPRCAAAIYKTCNKQDDLWNAQLVQTRRS